MSSIHPNVLSTIGRTPLVQLSRYGAGLPGRIAAKLESFNPGGSVKDRIALAMIEAAEASGVLQPGGHIVEPTSGNTGIGLAMVAAAKGYAVTFTMPETMSVERRAILAAYGAQVVLTPGPEGMAGAVAAAQQLATDNGWVMPQQFANRANVEVHRATTAMEIWDDTDGALDVFVSGVGTGGTVTGVGQVLKEKRPEIHVVAVEPTESPVLSGGAKGPHGIQGIGAGFVPAILDTTVYDEIAHVDVTQSRVAARALATSEGILAGVSSGAALHVARAFAADPARAGQLIVVLLPDTGERYLSTPLFADQ